MKLGSFARGLGICALLVLPSVGRAAVVVDCAQWIGADTLIEPWEETSRTFSRGSIRVAEVDLGEPDCCARHFIVLMPANMYGGRVCALVARNALVPNGWAKVGVEDAAAERVPEGGLRVSVPVYRYDPSTGGADLENGETVFVRVRQAAGTVELETVE